ncbi:NAD(P)/FAD-dependent oxidoreductase [Cytobacillus sp. Hz8]|uniref:NAD(P)/FAD-dependent oxidoreductase n=1 Tax=Cytobacillus sp. Hz8 TaxID=3347168 RepID=UPI0035E20534
MIYDCVVIGGGIAGLQAAIQLGRYSHKVLVIDAGDGRSILCHSYHNILGYPDGISGLKLREIGREQAEKSGVNFLLAKVEKVKREGNLFSLTLHNGGEQKGRRLLLATGVMDRIPPFPNLYPCLGKSVYVCPDCDGYEVKNQKVAVIGSGIVGANMALTLTYFTDQIILINHEREEIARDIEQRLKEKGIRYINQQIEEVLADGEQLLGFRLQDQSKIEIKQAFIAFGGNEVKSNIASQLGVERLENKHIVTNPRTKMTSVQNVWAAGDVAAHSEQVTIAMGEGSQAAIWIHKSIIK